MSETPITLRAMQHIYKGTTFAHIVQYKMDQLTYY